MHLVLLHTIPTIYKIPISNNWWSLCIPQTLAFTIKLANCTAQNQRLGLLKRLRSIWLNCLVDLKERKKKSINVVKHELIPRSRLLKSDSFFVVLFFFKKKGDFPVLDSCRHFPWKAALQNVTWTMLAPSSTLLSSSIWSQSQHNENALQNRCLLKNYLFRNSSHTSSYLLLTFNWFWNIYSSHHAFVPF